MQISRIIRPVNSLIFVSDSGGGQVPPWEDGKLIRSTNTCIAIGCYPEQDGPTKVTLGTADEVDPGLRPDFTGELVIPKRLVKVWGVTHETILEMVVIEPNMQVRIWLSHPRWPERVIIGVA